MGQWGKVRNLGQNIFALFTRYLGGQFGRFCLDREIVFKSYTLLARRSSVPLFGSDCLIPGFMICQPRACPREYGQNLGSKVANQVGHSLSPTQVSTRLSSLEGVFKLAVFDMVSWVREAVVAGLPPVWHWSLPRTHWRAFRESRSALRHPQFVGRRSPRLVRPCSPRRGLSSLLRDSENRRHSRRYLRVFTPSMSPCDTPKHEDVVSARRLIERVWPERVRRCPWASSGPRVKPGAPRKRAQSGREPGPNKKSG